MSHKVLRRGTRRRSESGSERDHHLLIFGEYLVIWKERYNGGMEYLDGGRVLEIVISCVGEVIHLQYFTRLRAIPGYVPLVLAGTGEACNVHSLSYNTSRIIGPSDEQSGLMWPVEGA